jgi:hypothetical protein
MRKVRMAIIDSEVREDHPAFKAHELKIIRFSGLEAGEGRCEHGCNVYLFVL